MKTRLHPSRFARTPRGFSLIEILVAVALLVVIMLGLLAMFYQTQRAFRQGLTQVDVLENGRTAMQLIIRELQGLSPSRVAGTTNLLAENISNGSTTRTQSLPAGETRANILHDIIFLTRENDEWRAIAYRVDNADLGVGTLYRLVTNAIPDTFNPDPEIYGLSGTAMNTGLNNPGFHAVIDGVVHLRLLAFDLNGIPINGFSSNQEVRAVGGNYVFMNGNLPAYLDVELGILEPRALAQFRARTNDFAKAGAYLEKHADKVHLFKQRIAIRTTQ